MPFATAVGIRMRSVFASRSGIRIALFILLLILVFYDMDSGLKLVLR